jgi:hypothetical protein
MIDQPPLVVEAIPPDRQRVRRLMGTWWNFQLIMTASVAGIIPSQSNMKVGLARAGYTRSTSAA